MKYLTYVGRNGIYAKVIKDSIYKGKRLTSLQIRAPKFLDAEFEKHRLLSSNSSSDRAIPFESMKKKDFYLPHDVRKNQPGMQGDINISPREFAEFTQDLKGVRNVIYHLLEKYTYVHKQHLNRYLLGFNFQEKIVTGTEWDNFFELRIDPAADPAIYELAVCMKEAMEMSTPEKLEFDEYHLPYVSEEEKETLTVDDVVKISVARCARVSYLNHDNSVPDFHKDIALYQMLLDSKHMSPFEHVARPMLDAKHFSEHYSYDPLIFPDGVTALDNRYYYWSGNFKGWTQHRHNLT